MIVNQANMGKIVSGYAITPSDTTTFDYDYIYVGGTGNVAVKFRDSAVVTLVGVPAGTIINGRILAVYATNTTATSIVGGNIE